MNSTAQFAVPARRQNETQRAPRLMIVTWEYPGLASQSGMALTRRVVQVIRGFADAGWRVDVIHRQQRHEDRIAYAPVADPQFGDLVFRYSVPGPGFEPKDMGRGTVATAMRVMGSYWYALMCGDRSGRWGRRAWKFIRRTPSLREPDLLIAFFTPRGPLETARSVHRKWKTPWIADLQDPALEGAGRHLRVVIGRWMRRALRSAAHVVQVSPEWALHDSRLLRRSVETMRHAVSSPAAVSRAPQPEDRAASIFRIVYAGSLSATDQDPTPFMRALSAVAEDEARKPSGVQLELCIAGPEAVYDAFRQRLSLPSSGVVRWLGWLEPHMLHRELASANCLLVIPWHTTWRQVVPSKVYDYIGTGVPVLLAGSDSGAIRGLLREWGHPDVLAADEASIRNALQRAIAGDASGMLRLTACTNRPLFESDLAAQYLQWAEILTNTNAASMERLKS